MSSFFENMLQHNLTKLERNCYYYEELSNGSNITHFKNRMKYTISPFTSNSGYVTGMRQFHIYSWLKSDSIKYLRLKI